jgi:diaminopimelate decarboxylase
LTGDSRIGLSPAEFEKANEIAQQHGFRITGLHFYRGTGTNATGAFTQAIDRLIAIAQQLPDWRTLDFGGGFGYPYRGGAVFDWREFGAAITQRLSALSRPIELVIEPGRSAIAGCGVMLAKVVSVKWLGDRQIVGVDTTVSNLSVPAVHGGYRAIATWDTDDVSRHQTIFAATRLIRGIIWGAIVGYRNSKLEMRSRFWIAGLTAMRCRRIFCTAPALLRC